MESLAHDLWKSGEKQWEASRLEAWLDEFLLAHPAISAAYANKDREVLKEDLRTATFVILPIPTRSTSSSLTLRCRSSSSPATCTGPDRQSARSLGSAAAID